MNRDLTVVSVHCSMMSFFEGFQGMRLQSLALHFMLGVYHCWFSTNLIPLSRWKARRHRNDCRLEYYFLYTAQYIFAHCLLDINVSSSLCDFNSIFCCGLIH